MCEYHERRGCNGARWRRAPGRLQGCTGGCRTSWYALQTAPDRLRWPSISVCSAPRPPVHTAIADSQSKTPDSQTCSNRIKIRYSPAGLTPEVRGDSYVTRMCQAVARWAPRRCESSCRGFGTFWNRPPCAFQAGSSIMAPKRTRLHQQLIPYHNITVCASSRPELVLSSC